MDDHAQDPQIKQTDASVVQQPQQVQPPFMPIGSMHKEAGPSKIIEVPVSEIISPSESAPEISPEVEQAGVEVSKNVDVPDLTMHDKKAGLEHAPVIAPVPTQPSGAVQLPLTPEQATETLKKQKNTKNSVTWLAESVLRQIKIMHGKITGGH